MTRTRNRRSGRRPGDSGTREAILAAATARFTAHGYDAATIRSIAADAGVDPALVHHFFGSKEHLFAAAMNLPIDPATVIPELVAPGIDGLGERLIRFFLTLFDQLGPANPLVALLRSVAAHEQAATMFREFYSKAVLERLAATLKVPQPRLRAALCMSQIIGLVMTRQIIGLDPLVRADNEVLVAAYAPALQHYLTGPLPESASRPRRGHSRPASRSGRAATG